MDEPQPVRVSKPIILYKFISGTIELLLGLGMLLFGRTIYLMYRHMKEQELFEDPHDFLINSIEKIIPAVVHHKTYIMSLLILLGVVKIIGAIGLLYKKEWGLDLLVGLFVFLLPFDLYSIATHPTAAKCIYLTLNIVIALSLVGFKPHIYLTRLKKYMKHRYPERDKI